MGEISWFVWHNRNFSAFITGFRSNVVNLCAATVIYWRPISFCVKQISIHWILKDFMWPLVTSTFDQITLNIIFNFYNTLRIITILMKCFKNISEKVWLSTYWVLKCMAYVPLLTLTLMWVIYSICPVILL